MRKTISRVYEEMELYLIDSLRRSLARDTTQDFERWQALKLRDIERFRQENQTIILKAQDEVNNLVIDSLMDAFKKAKNGLVGFLKRVTGMKGLPPKLEEATKVSIPSELVPGVSDTALKESILKNQVIEPEDNFFRMNDTKLKELFKAHTGELRTAESAVVRRMDDVYRQTLVKSQTFYNTGTYTLDQAIDMATSDFLKKGIDAIEYSDGKRVNIASYAEMALRTARHRAYLAAEGDKRKELGVSTVLVSEHATSCPLCIPWQSEILIDDVYSGGEAGNYPLLSTAMKQGLLH